MQLAQEHWKQPGVLFSEAGADAIPFAIINFESDAGYHLNIAQRDGIGMAIKEILSVLTGGAGVGKRGLEGLDREKLPYLLESKYQRSATDSSAFSRICMPPRV